MHRARQRDASRDDALAAKWEKILDVRSFVTKLLEAHREKKIIGSSLQANPTVLADDSQAAAFINTDPAEIFITSGAKITIVATEEENITPSGKQQIGVQFNLAEGKKCERCWRVLEEVGTVASYDDLCRRCAEVVAKLEQTGKLA